jgi:NitT/TauT family transport system permease protein
MRRWLGVLTIVILLGLWEAVYQLGLVNPLFLSAPSLIAEAAVDLFGDGFLYDVAVSLSEFTVGMAVALAIGVPLGLLLGTSRTLHDAFDPLLTILNSTPRVALLPLLLLWFGIGITSKIVVVVLGAIFPITLNVIMGMRTLDEQQVRCARSFGATRWQIVRTIGLPSTVPYLVSGIRMAIGRALISVVVAEMLASQAGIGHMMAYAGATFQTDKIFVGVALLAAFGVAANAALGAVEKRLSRWRGDAR